MIYKTIKQDIRLEKRKKIYYFISKNPGVHFRELSRRLNIPRTTLSYHLNCLNKLKIITERKENGFKRIYLSEEENNKDIEILTLIRQEKPLKILMYLLFFGYGSQIDISRELEVHPTTVEYHLKKLLRADIVERISNYKTSILNKSQEVTQKSTSRKILYQIKEDKSDKIIKILIENNIPDNLNVLDNFKFWLDKGKNILPNHFLKFDSSLDSIVKSILEIFPPPYYV